jgi:tungstate transport system substrate-binding protein
MRGSKRPVLLLLALVAVAALIVGGCTAPATSSNGGASTSTPTAAKQSLILASTTSTRDSGLFDVLIPAFSKAFPQYNVKVIAVGSGAALQLGILKQADVLLVHSPSAETTYMAGGYGQSRKQVMFNVFQIVGPASDPAKIANETSATVAFKKIAAAKATFVSRGDASGTNAKELKLWADAKITTPTPAADSWYISTGQGMGETLKVANEKGAYTITDRATWLSMKSALPDLTILFEKDKALLNQYGVIVIPNAKNEAGGQAFANYVLSPEGQKVIAGFGLEKYKEQLFTPNAK